mgnify:CR=1 FL=1
MPLLLDSYLHHPDIGDDRGMGIQCRKGCRYRIIAEPQETCHGKVADSNRTPLPDPVLGRCIPDNRTGQGTGLF